MMESILEVAEEKAREIGAPSIKVIKLRLGEFTAISKEALEFAFDFARQGTLAEYGRLEIEVVPMALHCVVCKTRRRPTSARSFICPLCAFPLKIISGNELQIDFIETEEREPAAMTVALV